MTLKDTLWIVGIFFAGFFVLEARHAPSAIEARVAKVESSFGVWEINNDIRKLKDRIKEIEREWAGKIIPESWLGQIRWLRDEIKKLEDKKTKLEV